MFNIAFLILWIIIIGLLIFLGYQGFRNVSEINESKNTFVLNTNNLSCYPGGNVENLPVVSNLCCVVNGAVTTQRPFTIPAYDLSVIVDTTPIPFSDACYGFCQKIDPVTGACGDVPDINEPYGRCLQATVPVSQKVNGTTITSNNQGCITSSLPVARLGLNPYYIQNPQFTTIGSQNVCSQTAVCA
jgi:hypothetical protein